jgi:hypothetical protein
MSNGFAGKSWKVGLSDTPVFPPGTVLTITAAGADYEVTVTNAGACHPDTNPLSATVSNGLLTTEPFTVACQPGGLEYQATATYISERRIAGAVEPAGGGRTEDEDEGTPAGTYTAEEEGGGGVET